MEGSVKKTYDGLKKNRTYLKGQLIRSLNRLKKLASDWSTDTEEVNRKLSLVMGRIKGVQVILDQMESLMVCNDLVCTDSGDMTEWAKDIQAQSDELESKAAEVSLIRTSLLAGSSTTVAHGEAATKDGEMLKLIEKLTKRLEDIQSDKPRPTIKMPGLSAPRWDGTPRNFQSWRVRIDQYFESAGVAGDQEKLMILLNSGALPKAVQDSIADCSSVVGDNGAWARLKEKVPKSAIIRDVLLGLESIKPMKSSTAREMRLVLDGLTDFARRMRELKEEQELKSYMTIEIVSRKIDSELYFEYMRQINEDMPSMTSLIEFLRKETEARERREQPHSLGDAPAKIAAHHIVDKSFEGDGACTASAIPIQFFTSNPAPSFVSSPDICPFCPGQLNHLIVRCPNFISKSGEERRVMVISAKRCFLCFRANHNAARCPRQDKKRCEACQLFHHRLVACPPVAASRSQPSTSGSSLVSATSSPELCFNQVGGATSLTPGQDTGSTQAGASRAQVTMGQTKSNQSGSVNLIFTETPRRRYSPTTYVELQDANGSWHRVIAFFDTGADTTLVKLSTANNFGLKGDPFTFTYGVAGGDTVKEESARYSIRIRPIKGDKSYDLVAVGIGKPAHNSPSIGEEIFDEYPYLTVAKGSLPTEEADIDILIGYDYHSLAMPLEIVKPSLNPESSPVATRNALGWTIFGGNIPKPYVHEAARVQFLSQLDDLQQLYTSDMVGVKPTTLCVCSDKEIAESQFIKHCREKLRVNEEGRMSVEMPWKPGFPEALECNRVQAEMRMWTQEKRLIKNETLDEYNSEMQKLIDNGFVRELSSNEYRNDGWYLQHHAVYQPHKTTKTRIVWNSAAKFKGWCLNDGFHKGPDFLNSLIQCLLHWRMEAIGIAGDVQKMFNQILLAPRDQKYHRFVWRFGDQNAPVRYWQWLRLPFGDKPAPDIAMMAVRLLAEAAIEIEGVGAHLIKNRMYMDDVTDSFEQAESATEAMDQVDRIMTRGSFRIKEWHSNNPFVDRCPEEKKTRVLGHVWDKVKDTMMVQLDHFDEEFSNMTKRKAAGLVAKFWDPTGMLSPVTIRYKIGLQNLWVCGIGWDDELNEEQTATWKEYVQEMNQLMGYRLSRRLRPVGAIGDPQLHGFSDASGAALGSVVWLRWVTSHGVELTFAVAKTLVAPLKQRSIPRLELTAAVVMSRLALLVLKVVGCVSARKFWTDSEVVLSWVRSPARTFKPFVSARVQEIQDALPGFADEFSYIPSQLNPADALTKPLQPCELDEWIQGPAFLRSNAEEWPCQEPNYDSAMERSVVKEYTPESLKRINSVRIQIEERFEERFTRLSLDWSRLVRIAAYCRRFLGKQEQHMGQQPISPSELREAELSLFFASQKISVDPDEMDHKVMRRFDPKLDERGLLRVGGRSRKLHIPDEQKHPVLLMRSSSLVKAYAGLIHRITGHQGHRVAIVTAFKRGVYILGGAKLFKDIAFKCYFCRTRRRLLLGQQMGELPSFRGNPYTPPFCNIALDFFGPVTIKLTRNTSSEGSILIVTCTTTRVISLELVESLSSEAFLSAWRRFVCTQGIHPALAFSDRGRNFVGAQEKLEKWICSWDERKIKEDFAKTGTKFEWKFNTPYASHMNGVVESLIRSCRRGLDAVADYHHKKFTALEWQTILAEVTYLVNSRPLFPDGPDPLKSPPITGNDILFPHGQPSLLQPIETTTTDLRSMVDLVQQRVQTFWETWLHYMPPQLVQRSKWFHPRDNLQVGDLVLLMEPGMKGGVAPRGLWRHGLVEAVYPGEDGLVRKVTVRTIENGRVSCKDRPVHKLCLIATVEELEHGFQTRERILGSVTNSTNNQ